MAHTISSIINSAQKKKLEFNLHNISKINTNCFDDGK